MEWHFARSRFEFLARAFEGSGGFNPSVTWQTNAEGVLAPVLLTSFSEPIRYPRESLDKFAGRNAVAHYENHLRSACERFVGFLGRRRPQRGGADSPLVKLMLEDADLRGSDLDSFWRQFALNARARGSMLLVIDKLDVVPANAADQQRLRAVPYIRSALPESVSAYEIDDTTGLFQSITLADYMVIDGKKEAIERDYSTTGWQIRQKDKVIERGEHAFGACQALAFTESGAEWPVVGKFGQVADLSRRLFNARSELDEILRSQTFSLLALQVPTDQSAAFEAVRDKVMATIGTNSMLIYPGEQPAFIAPDAGPAETYGTVIQALQESISRIAMEDVTSPTKLGSNESGVSRRLRFEALNSDLATFALNMQTLERRMWAMFARALGTTNGV